MKMDSFTTRSTTRKSTMTILLTYLFLFLLAFLGLKIAVITWLFFEGVLLFAFLLCLFFVSRTHWEIEFQGQNLVMYNTGNHQSYCFDSLTRSDFQITQNIRQSRQNSCDMKIRNTPFGIYDVQNSDALNRYLEAHF